MILSNSSEATAKEKMNYPSQLQSSYLLVDWPNRGRNLIRIISIL